MNEQQERESFEAWAGANGYAIDDMMMPLQRSLKALLYSAWLARAALAHPPESFCAESDPDYKHSETFLRTQEDQAALRDEGATAEQATAWLAVVDTLSEISPDWHRLDMRGMEAACIAIRALSDQAALRGDTAAHWRTPEQAIIDALEQEVAALRGKADADWRCWCESCDMAINKGWRTRMSVCSICGDKRCPRAKHHDGKCSLADTQQSSHGSEDSPCKESDGCPTELAVLQRYWRTHQATALSIALNVRHKDCHKAADAFWHYWRENGETHKHGYYESTWGAINRALRTVGVIPHEWAAAQDHPKASTGELPPLPGPAFDHVTAWAGNPPTKEVQLRYSADQMRAYARQAIEQAGSERLTLTEAEAMRVWDRYTRTANPYEDNGVGLVRLLEAAIRQQSAEGGKA